VSKKTQLPNRDQKSDNSPGKKRRYNRPEEQAEMHSYSSLQKLSMQTGEIFEEVQSLQDNEYPISF